MAPVCLLGGGGGGASDDDWSVSVSIFNFPTLADKDDGSYRGGSFLGAEPDAELDNTVEWFMCS